MKNCVLIILILPLITLAQFVGPAADPNGKYLDDPKYLLGVLYGDPGQRFFGELIVPCGNLLRDGRNSFSIISTVGIHEPSSIFRFLPTLDSFEKALVIPAGTVAIDDLNNDGFLDALCVTSECRVSNGCDTVRVYYGNSAGIDSSRCESISDGVLYNGFGQYCSVQDFDGDGKPELFVFAGATHPTLYIYKYGDTSLIKEPWFVWQQRGSVQVVDVNNDGLPDICVFNGGRSEGAFDVVYGRKGNMPDTANMFHWIGAHPFSSTWFTIGPMLSDSLNDIAMSLYGNGESRTFFFKGHKRNLLQSDFDTANASAIIRDPVEFGTPKLDYHGLSMSVLGNVNGSGQPSVMRVGNAWAGGGPTPYYYSAFLYSAGQSLDTRFDGQLDLASGNGDPGTPVDLGDLDGDSIHDFAVPDINYNNGAGRVFIIKGSKDYPHIPTLVEQGTNVPGSATLLQCYPNPISSTATITSWLATSDHHATLTITDALGRIVESHKNFATHPGKYELHFNASRWTSGNYFVRVEDVLGVRTMVVHMVR